MKRIITFSLLAAFFFSAKSQNLQVFDPDNGQADVSNDTLDFWMGPNSSYIKLLDVKNNNANNLTVKLKRIFVSGVNVSLPQDTCTICWNVCLPPSWGNAQTSGTITIPAGATINYVTNGMGFHSDFVCNGVAGVRIVRYTFYNSALPSDSVAVIARYHVTPTAISENDLKSFSFSNPMPNPASGNAVVKCDFPSSPVKAKIKIYNCMGSLIKEIKVEEQSGKININTDEMSNGIYFYSLVINDKIVGTKKLIVSN